MPGSEGDGEESPSSDVCDDYCQNLLADGMRLVDDEEGDREELDVERRIPAREEGHCPDWSLCEASRGVPVPPVVATGDVYEREVGKAEYASFDVLEAREVSEKAATWRAIACEVVDPVGKNLSPLASAASQRGAGIAPRTTTKATEMRPKFALSPQAAPFVPGTAPTLVTLPSAAAPTPPLAHAPRDMELPPPSPEMNSCSPSDRAGWMSIETHTLFAYRHFQLDPQPGTTYICPSMPDTKTRLGMHRAAEVLGCHSVSSGEGRERCVTLTWVKDGVFPIKERSVIMALRVVLAELFAVPKGKRRKGKKGESMEIAMKREARKSKAKEDKLEAAVRIADMGRDPGFLDFLVEREDWEAIHVLYDGARVPGLRKKKKKAKRNALTERTSAVDGQHQTVPSRFIPPIAVQGHAAHALQFIQEWDPGMSLPLAGFVEEQGRGQRGLKTSRPTPSAEPLESSNKGYAMLERMGWKQGEGLGTSKEGMKEPLQAQQRYRRSGLGASDQR